MRSTHLLANFFFDRYFQYILTVILIVCYSRLAVRSGKTSPCQDSGFGNRGALEALNDTKLILND